MIDGEWLPRIRPNQLDRCREMLWTDQDVVGEIELSQAGNTAAEIRPQHEPLIGLGLNNMAESAQPFELPEISEALGDVWRPQIDPAHHSQDGGMVLGQGEKEPGLLLGLIGLDGDGAVDACGTELEKQMLR
jgi:hypothetical protein